MYKLKTATESDIDTIKRQIKSDNVFLRGIVEECPHGYPAIIILDPESGVKGENDISLCSHRISNFLWLTCPYLNREIHDLESQGYIAKITDFINFDRYYITSMRDAHANYHFLRKYLCNSTREDDEDLFTDNINVFDTGIGGIKDINNLKCLHGHYAHFRICDKNIVGRVVYHLLDGNTSCKEVLCAHTTEKK